MNVQEFAKKIMQSVRTFYKQYDELKGFFERNYNNKNKRLTY